MPLVAHRELPAFAALRREGADVVVYDDTAGDELPTLRIGLLNLAPDRFLEATERQFMRVVSAFDGPIVFVHLLTTPSIYRGELAQAHVDRHYARFAAIREMGIDAVIVTGANPRTGDIAREEFWQSMVDVFNWAHDHITSTVCSCLTTRAHLEARHDARRIRLPNKCWGIYSHHVDDPTHPLLTGNPGELFGDILTSSPVRANSSTPPASTC